LLNQLFYLARFDPVVLPATYDCELALAPVSFRAVTTPGTDTGGAASWPPGDPFNVRCIGGAGADGRPRRRVHLFPPPPSGQAQVTGTMAASSSRPPSTRSRPIVPRGWRRRSVGDPGLN